MISFAAVGAKAYSMKYVDPKDGQIHTSLRCKVSEREREREYECKLAAVPCQGFNLNKAESDNITADGMCELAENPHEDLELELKERPDLMRNLLRMEISAREGRTKHLRVGLPPFPFQQCRTIL